MKSMTGFLLGFLILSLLPAQATATPMDFHITGSLTAGPSIFGTGIQQQGEDLFVEVPIEGEINVDLDYQFSLNDGESFAVSLDDKISLADLHLNHDISSLLSYDITADFAPAIQTLHFAFYPELWIEYAPYFGMYSPMDQLQNGFGFMGFDIVHNGVAVRVADVGDQQTIHLQGHLVTFTATRSSYNCGQLGYLGGFEITHLGSNPDPDPAPEPGTMLLFASGLLGLVGKRLCTKKSA